MTRSTALLVGLVLGACATDPSAPPGLFFPTAPRGDAYPAALITGQLVEAHGCLLISNPHGHGGTALPLWPEGFRAERAETGQLIVFEGDDPVAEVGDDIRFGGGFRGESRNELGPPQEFIGEAIPVRCRADSYWIVSP